MSLYNLMNGMNADLVILLSLLLNKRVDEYFPRFRNVFTEAEGYPDGDFYVYTRMGGGNRECWEHNDSKENCGCPACRANKIEQESWCVDRIDDSFDSTYCMFVLRFTDPEQRAAMDKLKAGATLSDVIADAQSRYTALSPSKQESEDYPWVDLRVQNNLAGWRYSISLQNGGSRTLW